MLALTGQAAQGGPPPVAPSPNACVPGTGSRNWCGDGRLGTEAKLAGPMDVASARDGALYVADTLNNVIRRITTDGVIHTIAGDAVADAMQPVEPAATAAFSGPRGVSAANDGSVLVADTGHRAIRRIAADGTVTVILGGPGQYQLRRPEDVVALPNGAYLVVDGGANKVLRVEPDGTVLRVAGVRSGRPGFTRRVLRGPTSPLRAPVQVAPLAGGALLIADFGNGSVRWLRTDGRLQTLARFTRSRAPRGVVASGGKVLASSAGGVVEFTRGNAVTPVAGTGRPGFTADTGPALSTPLNYPAQMTLAADGTLIIAEPGSDRIRRARVGSLTTIAGTDTPLPAGAATATASVSRGCAGYHPRFHIFDFLPFTDSVMRATVRRVPLKLTTSRAARVAVRLDYGSVRKARRHLGTVRNGSRTVVLHARLRRGRVYVARIDARSVGDNVTRCATRRVRAA
ncbi:NHL domain-containing protein [Solirubrobacter deserti]|uniref:Teneurin NHL domain-containing protein n=1 Tax=Solirubrobacter deserti TaxID=2282478 RepID=A0ABT4RE75_9ACTN|nr:hypothetical protein [Solirubrobacter deserti]MDA0136833.1 hypothetical protein [Solirubrobacter deserti]